MASEGEGAQVVEAMEVIGVLMGIEHGVNMGDRGAEQLEPEFRWGVHQQANGTNLDYRAGSGAPVMRVGGVTDGGPPPEMGDPHRGSRAQESEPHGQMVSTLRRLVVPGISNGTPQVTTTRDPSRAIPRARISVRAISH